SGVAVRGARRPDRDPRLAQGPELEAPAVPEGDDPVRGAVQVRGDRRPLARAAGASGRLHPRPDPAAAHVAERARLQGDAARAGAQTVACYAVATVAACSRPSSSIADSRILNFCTLPVTVIGKESTNFT